MELDHKEWPLCQSCGLQMKKPRDFGLNSDKTANNEYCRFCFWDGKFIQPNVTVGEMIDKATKIIATMNSISEEESKDMVREFVPRLKRWNK